MIIELAIVVLSFSAIGYMVSNFTGLPWYWVAAITMGILLFYDCINMQDEVTPQETERQHIGRK